MTRRILSTLLAFCFAATGLPGWSTDCALARSQHESVESTGEHHNHDALGLTNETHSGSTQQSRGADNTDAHCWIAASCTIAATPGVATRRADLPMPHDGVVRGMSVPLGIPTIAPEPPPPRFLAG